MFSFGFPLFLAGTAVAQTTTMAVFFPGLESSDSYDGVKGSIVGVENSLTTVALSCDYDSYIEDKCDYYFDDYTVTLGSNTYEMVTLYEENDYTETYSMGCSLAPKSAVCTFSYSGDNDDWEDYCVDSYTSQDPAEVASCILDYSTHQNALTITTIGGSEMTYMTVTVADGAELLTSATAGAAASKTGSASATATPAASSSYSGGAFASDHDVTFTSSPTGLAATPTSTPIAKQGSNSAVSVRGGAYLTGLVGFVVAVFAL
ncbi:uncharacterized protein K452DRAFT_318015 [Aplosporella prunicola CBS 121167]|uniref:Uncharacterized protein n=1 Tax=Aplosporella prunicola CBS 121167 TaxID=1176127 RepID=A0A6A6BFM4_9PEZI|nr:uncharacterized protein K452DRAFT_318015 [Aplosporella prunicola CBS 121167]KAF2142358.1 hypothetical protein K452DRAFT_318015 [Aplosporella prunicola CBS 121167]